MSLKKLFNFSLFIVFGLMLCGCTVNKDKEYVFCSDNSFPPFEYWDPSKNEYVGIDVDMIEAIAQNQKLIYSLNFVGFDAACGNVQSGQADAIIDPVSITEERKLVYDFSDPFFFDGQIMVVSPKTSIQSLEDLKGTVVAAKNGSMGTVYAEKNKDKYGYDIQYYDDSPSMYQGVISGINSACFEDYSVMAYAINSGVDLAMIGEVINPVPCAFAVKKGENQELLDKINKGLNSIRDSGIYEDILHQYGMEYY